VIKTVQVQGKADGWICIADFANKDSSFAIRHRLETNNQTSNSTHLEARMTEIA
jgi:hypothetical protein